MASTGLDRQFKAVRGTIWAAFAFTVFMYFSCLAGNFISGKCVSTGKAGACEGERQGVSMAFAACLAGVLGLNTRNPRLRSGKQEDYLEIEDDFISGPIRKIEEDITGFRNEVMSSRETIREVINEQNLQQNPEEIVPGLGADVLKYLTKEQKNSIYKKVWRERHHFDKK
jgi:hypothetical protein